MRYHGFGPWSGKDEIWMVVIMVLAHGCTTENG